MHYLENKNVRILNQSPYSPDLNLLDRWVNEHVKQKLWEVKFECAEDFKEQILDTLRNTEIDKFQFEIDKLMEHCEKVITANGEYIVLE